MPGKLGALIALEAGAGVKASSENKGFRPESIISHYQHVSREQHRRSMAITPPLGILNIPRSKGLEDDD